MTKVRFLLDDVGQSQTQRSVLRAFVADVESRSLGEVIWASGIPELLQWTDVPAESSRRLGLRLFALQPETNQMTVFLPGHIVPGELSSFVPIDHAFAAASFSSVSGLDLFVIDNAALEVKQYQNFVQTNPDYESVSSFDAFSIRGLPAWLISGGLISCLRLTDRPWYSVFAPARVEWLAWVQRALERGDLTISMVQADISDGLVRPSLLNDVKCLANNRPLPPLSDSALDGLFVYPECRLSDSQYQLLHSKALQTRTIEYANRQTARKLGKQKGLRHWARRALSLIKRARSMFKRTFKFAYLTAYKIYAISLRPMVKRLFNRGGI